MFYQKLLNNYKTNVVVADNSEIKNENKKFYIMKIKTKMEMNHVNMIYFKKF